MFGTFKCTIPLAANEDFGAVRGALMVELRSRDLVGLTATGDEGRRQLVITFMTSGATAIDLHDAGRQLVSEALAGSLARINSSVEYEIRPIARE